MKDLDYTPDAALAERIRDSLPRRPSPWRDGETIAWFVVDEQGNPFLRTTSRDDARELAGKDGDIAKLVRSH